MQFFPHPYQREAIQRLIDNDHYGLLLDMGLGKTVSTLTAIEELLYDYADISKVLIIAPRKVAESTWQDEVSKWDHLKRLTFSTVLGSERERIAALHREADCYVINRENVVWLCDYYRGRLPFDTLIIDESSSFKNPQAKRFKALKRVRMQFKRIYLLTGTPAPNTLMDIWSQMYLLDAGEALGKTITSYRLKYFTPDKTNGNVVYSYKLRPGSADEIYKKVGTRCMSLKASDYLKLPARIDNTITVTMDPAAQALYKKLVKELCITVDESDITAATAGALANKLLQLANGAIYDDDKGVVLVHDAKLKALEELVENNEGKPILVFYSYKHDLARLQKAFPQAQTLANADVQRKWNAGEIPILLAHPGSAGYGLNLQAGGNIIVWFGLTWSLEQYQQANARLYRQGQNKPVIIHHIVTKGTRDEQVIAALARKDLGQAALLNAVKATIKEVAAWS